MTCISDSVLDVTALVRPSVPSVLGHVQLLVDKSWLWCWLLFINCLDFTKSQKKRRKADTVVTLSEFSYFQQPGAPSIAFIVFVANLVDVNIGIFVFESENSTSLKHLSLKIWCLMFHSKTCHQFTQVPESTSHCYFFKVLSKRQKLCVKGAWEKWLREKPYQSSRVRLGGQTKESARLW